MENGKRIPGLIVAESGLEGVFLAGGLGTRIRAVEAGKPKVMMDVGGRPFLEILLKHAMDRGLRRAILATGYKHECIESHFGNRFQDVEILYSRESRPLGTGGAAWKALKIALQEDVFVFNGDSFFDLDLAEFYAFHKSIGADASMALKPMLDFDRYGTVQAEGGRITGFREKQREARGLINGGIYLLNRSRIAALPMPETFSIERDFFERYAARIRMGAFVRDGYFIDIGVPEDYERARREMRPTESHPAPGGASTN